MFTPFPYLNNYYKIIGLLLILVSLIISIFQMPYSIYNEWLLLFGLFTIAYTKDDHPDQSRFKTYRYNSFRLSFAIIFFIIIFSTFTNLTRDLSNEMNMIFFGIIYLVLYLIIYYAHIIFKIKNLEPDHNVKENYKQNKKLYRISIIVLAILILIFTLRLLI
jgi:hypothetical protein